MRILHVVRQFSPGIGGLENFVLSLVKAQIDAGHEAEVLTLDSIFNSDVRDLEHYGLVEGIPVHRVCWFGSYKYPIALKSLSLIKGYDLVHVHAVDFFADYLSFLRFIHKTPMVISTHGGFFHTKFASNFKKLYFNLVTRFSLRGYKKVIACSDGDYEQFKRVAGSRLCLIENGVDTNKFSNNSSREFAYRFIYIGRFSDNKRLDLLIDTFRYLSLKTHEVKLTIVGRDWDNNHVKMKEQISKLNLSDSVEVLTDLEDASVSKAISNSCFIISASEYEGFGLTLVEGMSAGLIPIASSITSFKKIVSTAKLGLVVNFNHPGDAANKIYEYIEQSKSDYFQLRSSAISVSALYSWEKTCLKFLNLYEDILGLDSRVIQGVNVHARSGAQVVTLIEQAVLNKQCLKVAIANAHTINLARKNRYLHQVLKGFLVLNDGVGINLASKFKYNKWFGENLNGTDFIPRLLNESKLSLKIYLLGANQYSVERAFSKYSNEYPQHQWLGFRNGYFSEAEEESICNEIKSVTPDLLLVAMGNPIQEEWIDRCAEKSGALVSIGVGALFDFASGKFNRAPVWIRKINCEWIYRLMVEPKRMWRRYLIGNIVFLIAALGDKS